MAPATDGLGAGHGVDFGWSAFEAFEPFNDDQASPDHFPPLFAYPHADGDCSVSGGAVARTSSFDELNGWYVFGDFCSGRVWALDTTSAAPSPDGPVGTPRIAGLGRFPGLSAVVEGPDGDLYALSVNGPVARLAPRS